MPCEEKGKQRIRRTIVAQLTWSEGYRNNNRCEELLAPSARRCKSEIVPLPLSVVRHFISTGSQYCHLYTELAVYWCLSLSFCRSLFAIISLLFFSARPSSIIISRDAHATTHYMRTIYVRSLEISSFVSVEMQRRSFSLLLVLCNLGTVVGDIVLLQTSWRIKDSRRYIVCEKKRKTKVGACKLFLSLKITQIFIHLLAIVYSKIINLVFIAKTQVFFRHLFYIKYVAHFS